MSHTPGPWHVDGVEIIADGGRCIVWELGQSLEDRTADAALIAAAPDLLAALKTIAANSDEENEWDAVEKLHANLAAAEAAIAKAEGR